MNGFDLFYIYSIGAKHQEEEMPLNLPASPPLSPLHSFASCVSQLMKHTLPYHTAPTPAHNRGSRLTSPQS